MPTLYSSHNYVFGPIELGDLVEYSSQPNYPKIIPFSSPIASLFQPTLSFPFLDFGLLPQTLLPLEGEPISSTPHGIPHTKTPSTRHRDHLIFNLELANDFFEELTTSESKLKGVKIDVTFYFILGFHV
jgi:hypothetical protein